MLVHEGFVEVRPRQGYRVTDVTLGDVRGVYHLRLLLEPATAELAAQRATPEQLQALRSSSEDPSETDYEVQVRQATVFNATFANASGNSRLAATLNILLDEMQRLRFIGGSSDDRYENESAEHRELFDALLKGNRHLARGIAQRHVEEDRMRMFEDILGSLSTAGASVAASQIRLSPNG